MSRGGQSFVKEVMEEGSTDEESADALDMNEVDERDQKDRDQLGRIEHSKAFLGQLAATISTKQ